MVEAAKNIGGGNHPFYFYTTVIGGPAKLPGRSEDIRVPFRQQFPNTAAAPIQIRMTSRPGWYRIDIPGPGATEGATFDQMSGGPLAVRVSGIGNPWAWTPAGRAQLREVFADPLGVSSMAIVDRLPLSARALGYTGQTRKDTGMDDGTEIIDDILAEAREARFDTAKGAPTTDGIGDIDLISGRKPLWKRPIVWVTVGVAGLAAALGAVARR